MIKLSQTVWELWPAQEFGFRGNKYITKRVKVVSLVYDTTSDVSTNYFKIFQTIKKLWSAEEFGLEIRSGEIIRKITKQELSFLHATCLLDLIYIPTKYYQIISNSMGV